jgi:hypothetical protein
MKKENPHSSDDTCLNMCFFFFFFFFLAIFLMLQHQKWRSAARGFSQIWLQDK